MIIEFLCVSAENISAYDQLMEKDPQLISHFLEDGLDEEILQGFIGIMEEEANRIKTPEAREIMEDYFINLLLYAMQLDDYIPVMIALDVSFPEEIIYLGENWRVPPRFEIFFLILMEKNIAPESDSHEEYHPPLGGGYYETPENDEEIPTPEVREADKEIPIFSDLENHEWAKFYIKELYEKNILNGYEDGTFRPDKEISRSELIKLVTVLLLDKSYKNEKSEYDDISPDAWFYEYLLTSEYFCVMKDIYKDNLEPFEPVTRQELTAIIYRAILRSDIKLPLISLPCEFVDFYEFANFAHDPIRELQKAGVVSGTGDNKFSPQKTTTRAEAAKIIYIVSSFK